MKRLNAGQWSEVTNALETIRQAGDITKIRKPDQIIQPWQFGHPESKSTCLWLKGLARLVPTDELVLPPGGRWENQTASGQNKQ